MKFISSLKTLISLFSNIELDYQEIDDFLHKHAIYERVNDSFKIVINKINNNELSITLIQNANILKATITTTANISPYIESIMDLSEIHSTITFDYLLYNNSKYDTLNGKLIGNYKIIHSLFNNKLVTFSENSNVSLNMFGIKNNETLFNITFNLIPSIFSYLDNNSYYSISKNYYEDFNLVELEEIKSLIGDKLFEQCAAVTLKEDELNKLGIKYELKK